jgi:hypothetical protein
LEEVRVMAVQNHTDFVPYIHPDDPAGYLRLGDRLMVGGLDFSWCYVCYAAIPGYTGYLAGTNGTVWSCLKLRGLGTGKGSEAYVSDDWHQVKSCAASDGYRLVRLCGSGVNATRRVHALVLMAFYGPRPAGMQCCHRDHNRANNRIENLRWGTVQDNMNDRQESGRTARGERGGMSMVTDAIVEEIRRLRDEGISYGKLGKKFGLSRWQTMRIAKREAWKHV